jgi:hypothetical protein
MELQTAPPDATIDRLRSHIDRNVIERERIRLALRALLTLPITEALPGLIKVARECNPDVPPVAHLIAADLHGGEQ